MIAEKINGAKFLITSSFQKMELSSNDIIVEQSWKLIFQLGETIFKNDTHVLKELPDELVSRQIVFDLLC